MILLNLHNELNSNILTLLNCGSSYLNGLNGLEENESKLSKTKL